MTDILIRNVPDAVVTAVDARAARLGLSRTEYLRRRLAQEATGPEVVTVNDLIAFSATFTDLGDESVMAAAWR